MDDPLSQTLSLPSQQGVEAASIPLDVYLFDSLSSDLILHHRNTHFHVHKFVVHHHSSYFRALLDGMKRQVQKTDEDKIIVSLDISDPRCNHCPLIDCVYLPDKFGIDHVDDDELHMALRHLYFASTLAFPPYWPNTEIVQSITQQSVTCFTYPSTSPTTTDVEKYALTESEAIIADDKLISVFHYFGCQSSLDRCEQVILAHVVSNKDAWYWLPIVSRFGLMKAEEGCIEKVTKNVRFDNNKEYKTRIATLCFSPDLVLKVMAALTKSRKRSRVDREREGFLYN